MAPSGFLQRLLQTMMHSLLLKVLTFTLTACFTRSASHTLRGMLFFLDLYGDTIGFLAREAVRCTALRAGLPHLKTTPKREMVSAARRLMSTAFFAGPIALLLIGVCEGLYRVSGGRSVLPAMQMHLSGVASGTEVAAVYLLFVLGQLFQMTAEPEVCVVQALGRYKVKVSAESFALCCRVLTLLGAAQIAQASVERNQLLMASIAHVVYGAAFCFWMKFAWWRARRQSSSTWSAVDYSLEEVASALSDTSVSLRLMRCAAESQMRTWIQFFSESCVRLFLTEGEKFVLASFGSLAEQGVYDTVMNLGSIVARLVFRLWEETCFAKWSTMMTSSASVGERYTEAYALLRSMLSIAATVSVPFVIFGPPLSAVLLRLVFSSRWSDPTTTAVLARLCVALLPMALNGLLEAFVRATSSPAVLARAKLAMLGASVLYVALCGVCLVVLERGVIGLMECLAITTCLRCVLNVRLIAVQRQAFGVGTLSTISTIVELFGRAVPSAMWAFCAVLGAASHLWLADRPLTLSLVAAAASLVVLYGIACVVFDAPYGARRAALRIVRRQKQE